MYDGKVRYFVTLSAVVVLISCPHLVTAEEQTGTTSDGINSNLSSEPGAGAASDSRNSSSMGAASDSGMVDSTSPSTAPTGYQAATPTTSTAVSSMAAPVAVPPAMTTAPTPTVPPAAQPAEPTVQEEASPEPINTRKKFGFGVELQANVNDPVNLSGGLTLRSWPSNVVALQPSFIFGVEIEEGDVTVAVSPGLDLLFSVYKGRATRINFGFGFSFLYGRIIDRESASAGSDSGYGYDDSSDSDYYTSSDDTDDYAVFAFSLPMVLQLEHFVTDWLSLYVGARFNLLRVELDDVGNDPDARVSMAIDTSALQLGIIFYHF